MILTALPAPGIDSGLPDAFGAIFALILLVGIGLTIYKVTIARTIATKAGMDPDDATRVTLLSDNGFEATYLAANLPGQGEVRHVPDAPESPNTTVAARLRELNELLEQGLITDDEFATRRSAIIASL